MYEGTADLEWLYPGDVIRGIELPNIKTEDFRLRSTSDSGKEYTVRTLMEQDFFVYLSHECDFNDNKRQFVILAPMLNIDQGLRRSPDAFERLKKSNDVENYPYYLNLFYYSPSTPTFPNEMIVDFTRVISFPRKRAEQLLLNKCLQLTAESRSLIKAKLGYYFCHEQECPFLVEQNHQQADTNE